MNLHEHVRYTDKIECFEKSYRMVKVLNGVWIGANVLINAVFKTSNGTVISSESVVVSDAGDYAIVKGNPAN